MFEERFTSQNFLCRVVLKAINTLLKGITKTFANCLGWYLVGLNEQAQRKGAFECHPDFGLRYFVEGNAEIFRITPSWRL